MSLVRLLGTIFPGATAMISTEPIIAQPSAMQNTARIAPPSSRAVGEGGVSITSNAAGRKAVSNSVRRAARRGRATTFPPGPPAEFLAGSVVGFSADVMNAGLH